MNKFKITGLDPAGFFVWGIHNPSYEVLNIRRRDFIFPLGHVVSGDLVTNEINFPKESIINIRHAQSVYEIPNVFPFWGTSFVLKDKADKFLDSPNKITLMPKKNSIFKDDDWTVIKDIIKSSKDYSLKDLPRSILITIAICCEDEELLCEIAKLSCKLEFSSKSNTPTGISYEEKNNQLIPIIYDHDLFESVANNPYLPDSYKRAMVLNPGVQGRSPIVGDYFNDQVNIFEYLRSNSYIAWGHYASNMAHDSVRYTVASLTLKDIEGLRHLYYQRTYIRLANMLKLEFKRRFLDKEELEKLRISILEKVRLLCSKGESLEFNATLWGWNYGFGFTPTGFRLHASHQQIHQQFALIPKEIEQVGRSTQSINSYAIGDLIAQLCKEFRCHFNKGLFNTLIKAIKTNKRTDYRDDVKRSSLIVYEDKNVIIYVPKAQRFQSEVHILTLNPIGNILEADIATRASLDKALLLTIKGLYAMGAKMVTCCEASKRLDDMSKDQHLLYYLLPKNPISPGSFSEWQLRWICGHYPEDFAYILSKKIKEIKHKEKIN